MALHRRDLVGVINSVNSQIFTQIGVPASALEGATSTVSVKSTTSSSPSTTSAKTTSTVKSTASSTAKSTDPASSSTKSAAASTITSSLSTASESIVTSSSRLSSNSSPSPSSTTHSSTTSTSTQTTTLTSTPTPTSTVLTTTSTPSGNSISTVGLAVAIIFALLILGGTLYLLWKYLPAARRYRERAYIARSHRDGLSFSDPRKGLAFTDEESTHDRDLPLDDPKLGLGLREFDYHAAPTYHPGGPRSYGPRPDADRDLSQRRPLASASSELERAVNPLETRSARSQFSYSALPSALQAGPSRYVPRPYQPQYQYQDFGPSQIGVAVPFAGGGSGNGNSRPGSRERGLPPLPLPSIGYGRPFS